MIHWVRRPSALARDVGSRSNIWPFQRFNWKIRRWMKGPSQLASMISSFPISHWTSHSIVSIKNIEYFIILGTTSANTARMWHLEEGAYLNAFEKIRSLLLGSQSVMLPSSISNKAWIRTLPSTFTSQMNVRWKLKHSALRSHSTMKLSRAVVKI
jgi:hypothetical protein